MLGGALFASCCRAPKLVFRRWIGCLLIRLSFMVRCSFHPLIQELVDRFGTAPKLLGNKSRIIFAAVEKG